MTSALINFYDGSGSDAAGRSLDDILAWDDHRLEAVHDYIQWLFPLPEASAFNARAPILDAADIIAFAAPSRQAALRRALRRMLAFYGYDLVETDGATAVTPSSGHARRTAAWITPGNHNFLRITRILRSLVLLGLPGHARAVLAALGTLADGNQAIGATTRRFWRDAVPPAVSAKASPAPP